MSKSILYCKQCKEYTLQEKCPHCGERTFPNKPPKYSPEDKYASYRRQAKEEMKEKNKNKEQRTTTRNDEQETATQSEEEPKKFYENISKKEDDIKEFYKKQ